MSTTTEFVPDARRGVVDDDVATTGPRSRSRLRLDRIITPPNRPNKEAVRDLGTDRSFTYAELDRRIDAMAAYLTSLGIGRGDRVAVLAHNGVEFFDIQFACARTGSICVLLNWRLTVTELEYILNDSSPMLLVHDIAFAESAAELQRRCSIGDAARDRRRHARTARTRRRSPGSTARPSNAWSSPTTT